MCVDGSCSVNMTTFRLFNNTGFSEKPWNKSIFSALQILPETNRTLADTLLHLFPHYFREVILSMEPPLDAWNIFNDLLKKKKRKDLCIFCFFVVVVIVVVLNTCDTHQAVAPCLMNTAAWCQSWPSRRQPSAKIQQIHRLCAWSQNQGERQQQPCPAPFSSISGQKCLVFAYGEWTD